MTHTDRDDDRWVRRTPIYSWLAAASHVYDTTNPLDNNLHGV